MSDPKDIRIPLPGEGWRHYKGGYQSLYEIIGTGRDEHGNAVVVYKPYDWTLAQPAPIYVRQLADFLFEIDTGIRSIGDATSMRVQRFTLERIA
jgi:hypothetical protein